MAISALGNYQLERLLGKGGYAEIYLGKHMMLGTSAAIKILQAAKLTREEEADFIHEARLVARLDHPHIVRLLEFGMQEKTLYLVMEYAPHGSLANLHPRGQQVRLDLINSYVEQVADALQYAHNQGVVHRDVKPSNMLVKSNGDILVSDFGLALAYFSVRVLRDSPTAGTPIYMAPEQIQGSPGIASDQYALAIATYEWLTGVVPFHSSNVSQIFFQHTHSPVPPLHALRSDIQPEIEFVLRRALAKNPADRFPSVTDFAKALKGAIFSGPTLITTLSEFAVSTRESPPGSAGASFAPMLPEQDPDQTDKHAAPTGNSPIDFWSAPAPYGWHASDSPAPVAPALPLPANVPSIVITNYLGKDISVLAPREQGGSFIFPAPPGQTLADFFISYTKADRPRAFWVANLLRQQGFSVFFPPVDFRAGFVFQKEAQKAFSKATRMLTIISPDYSAALQSRRGGWKVFQRAARGPEDGFFAVCVHTNKDLKKRLFHVENYLDIAGDDEMMAQRMLLAYVLQTSVDALPSAFTTQIAPPPFTPPPPSMWDRPAVSITQPGTPAPSTPPAYPVPMQTPPNYPVIETTWKADASSQPQADPAFNQTLTRPPISPPVPPPPSPSSPANLPYDQGAQWATVKLPQSQIAQAGQTARRAISIFVSYTEEDENYRKALEIHLDPLKRGGLIESWHNGEIKAGEVRETEINEHLQQAMLVLLLISPEYIGSQYCYEQEMQMALQRHRDGLARVIPILVRPSSWKDSPFRHLVVLPKSEQPIALAPNVDQMYVQVVNEIRLVVQDLLKVQPPLLDE